MIQLDKYTKVIKEGGKEGIEDLAKGYQKSLINKQVEESDELRALYE